MILTALVYALMALTPLAAIQRYERRQARRSGEHAPIPWTYLHVGGLTMSKISISQDGEWAGSGRINEHGAIVDCAARLGPDGLDHASGEEQEYTERVYAAIEAAIARGERSLVMDEIRYEWDIEGED